MKARNAFKPTRRIKKTAVGSAGYDNARENIDPHIKTKVLNTIEGTIEDAPTANNHIVNKAYADALGGGGVTLGAAEPGSPSEGDLFINTTTHIFKLYYLAAWNTLHSFAVGDAILLETGDTVLLETGDKLLQEA